RNTAALAAREVMCRAGISDVGLAIRVQKGLPLAGGQGGSAASAVAGAGAVDHLLGGPPARTPRFSVSLVAGAAAARRRADNVAPALFGGIVLIRAIDPPDLVQVPVPADLRVVLAHPDQRLRTRDARAVLPRALPLETALYQAAQVSSMVAGLAAGDYELLG